MRFTSTKDPRVYKRTSPTLDICIFVIFFIWFGTKFEQLVANSTTEPFYVHTESKGYIRRCGNFSANVHVDLQASREFLAKQSSVHTRWFCLRCETKVSLFILLYSVLTECFTKAHV